jgi:adenosylhomocysteine nucleosidase
VALARADASLTARAHHGNFDRAHLRQFCLEPWLRSSGSRSNGNSRRRNLRLILIFCAFGAELEPLRARVQDEQALGIEGLKGCYGRIGTNQIALIASGIGMRRAQASALRALDVMHDVDLVILTGVAGALANKLEIGDVVMADRLMTRDGDSEQPARTIEVPPDHFETYSSALDAAGIRYTRGALLTVKYALATGAEKRRAAEHTGAIAVDMETAVIAFEAAARGIPFVAMRTIMDKVDHDLAGAGLADENGKVRPLKAAATLVRNPAMVAGVIRLVRNLRRAADSMAFTIEAVTRRVG